MWGQAKSNPKFFTAKRSFPTQDKVLITSDLLYNSQFWQFNLEGVAMFYVSKIELTLRLSPHLLRLPLDEYSMIYLYCSVVYLLSICI